MDSCVQWQNRRVMCHWSVLFCAELTKEEMIYSTQLMSWLRGLQDLFVMVKAHNMWLQTLLWMLYTFTDYYTTLVKDLQTWGGKHHVCLMPVIWGSSWTTYFLTPVSSNQMLVCCVACHHWVLFSLKFGYQIISDSVAAKCCWDCGLGNSPILDSKLTTKKEK